MSRKPVFRVRRSGALVIAAVIAFVGAVPFAGAKWELAPLLLIPLAVIVWAWRAGTDVTPEGLKVRALFGSTDIAWSRVIELAPDANGRIQALLNDGNAVELTAVTQDNLPAVLAAGGQELNNPESPR
ncbi:PH domain-containing protein [Symbioplanes lichenis]|uniref:PH domain-containing protein n=1 Tax=Symbioplanes lichenis TaxID=1629072 RepID=UPI0027392377|nr:PH domain-containing protein [Actinoplanes lichenis]